MKQYLLVFAAALALAGCEREPAGEAESEQPEESQVAAEAETAAMDETVAEEVTATDSEVMDESMTGEDESAMGKMEKCADFGAAATVSVNITSGNPGDSVTGEFICHELGVIASCTATVAAGETTAECTSDPVDVSGIDQEQHCASQVLAGNPDFGVTCAP